MMTVTLPEDLESQLQAEASRHGVAAVEYAVTLIRSALPPGVPVKPQIDQATLNLLARWDREDATDDPEELALQQQEGEEFMKSLAQSRIDMEGPDARKLWP